MKVLESSHDDLYWLLAKSKNNRALVRNIWFVLINRKQASLTCKRHSASHKPCFEYCTFPDSEATPLKFMRFGRL